MKIIEFPKTVKNGSKKRKAPKKYNLDKADFNNILEEGEAVWRCNCGSVLFFLTPDGAKCQQCGFIAMGWMGAE